MPFNYTTPSGLWEAAALLHGQVAHRVEILCAVGRTARHSGVDRDHESALIYDRPLARGSGHY